jgi:uncharacterized protein (DUF1499 family)
MISSLVLVIPLIVLGPLFYLGHKSKDFSFESLGIDGKELKPCGENPNCVFSGGPSTHFIEPLAVEDGIVKIKQLLATEPGFSLLLSSSDYLYYQYTSTLFGFVDDLEFKADGPSKIQVRSASRVGKSDLGANRRRVERIRTRLNPNR